MRPPLARSTALMTVPSMEGKASLRVFSACCSGANGRGGFGGGASSREIGFDGAVALESVFGEVADVSAASSSKSRALAVVGDSARSSTF